MVLLQEKHFKVFNWGFLTEFMSEKTLLVMVVNGRIEDVHMLQKNGSGDSLRDLKVLAVILIQDL